MCVPPWRRSWPSSRRPRERGRPRARGSTRVARWRVPTSFIHRHLDPAESLGEVLFGLIMVLTFTLGAAVAGGYKRGMLLAAVGCNVAWGVIDGVLFVLSGRFARRPSRSGDEATTPTSSERPRSIPSRGARRRWCGSRSSVEYPRRR